jgi:pimeloyl-ACP methyl ester carboxylesterase
VIRSKKMKGFAAFLVLAGAVGAAFWARPLSFFWGYSALSLRVAGAQSRSTIVSGYRIHYYVLGPDSGPPLVLVHGLGGQAADWQKLAPFLTKAGFRVYLPDLPGYGESEQPANFSYSTPDEAFIVVGFLDAAGLKQVDLGGWSMGGWIVQRVASDHPDRVRRLLLFDSAGLYRKPDWNTALFTPASPAELDQLDVLLMPKPPVVPGFIARDFLRTSQRNAWVIHRALDSMLTGRDVTDNLLPDLKMPVLIVWGAEDRITPLSQGEKIHKLISQSQLEVIGGCGHLAPNECADQIGPIVVKFVQR